MTIILGYILDEWSHPKVNHTQLSKKERNRVRYNKRQARIEDERERARRTRPSDISPPRITDGMSGKCLSQSHYAPKPKPVTMGGLLTFAAEFDEAQRLDNRPK